MKKSMKIEMRRSEIRQRLSEIGELSGDALTDEIRAERDRLTREYRDSEPELRAAQIAEDVDRRELEARDGTGAELRALEGRVSLGAYIDAAARSEDVSGAEAEHRAALWGDGPHRGPGGVLVIPWAVLAGPRPEARADAATALPATGAQTIEDEWVGRVFSTGHAAYAGVDVRNAGGPGERSIPVITAGPSGGMAAAGGAQDAQAFTVANSNFEPHRATIGYIYRIEDAARSGRMDPAFRADISMRLVELTDNQVLNGSGASGQVSGFLAALTDPDNPTNTITFAIGAGLAGERIDGLHAMTETDVRFLLSEDTVKKLAKTYATNDDSVDLLSTLRRRSGGVRACSLLPAPASNITRGLAAKTGTMRNASMMFFDGGVHAVTDTATRAGRGEIRVFLHALFDFKIHRSAAFDIVEAKIA
ncbi:MAG: hypothetical protein OXG72_08410 [Acidobacteria bacterium]|nr:hypothetical protein [Acidobacteriota bacterium]